MFAPLAQALSQLAQQTGQFIVQELSKPHNQAHIAHMAGKVIEDLKKKKNLLVKA